MALTPANYNLIVSTINTTANAVWTTDDAEITHPEWATIDPMSGGSQMVYAWMGRMPKPRPWYGSRVMYEAALQSYAVQPEPYESTYGIDRFVLDDSSVQTQSPFWRLLPDQAYQWRRQPEYELRDLIENTGIWTGSKQLGWDGLNYFSTAHYIDIYNPNLNPGPLFSGGTYCNDFVGGQTVGGITVGGTFSQTAFSSLVEYMPMIPDESGEVLGVMPDAIMHPSTLKVEVAFVLKASFLASPNWGAFSPITGQVGAADNQLAKMGMRSICNPFLKNASRYYVMDTKRAFKPFIWVVREAPKTVPRVSENDPIVWEWHKYAWGGWDRVAAAFGPSFLCLRGGTS